MKKNLLISLVMLMLPLLFGSKEIYTYASEENLLTPIASYQFEDNDNLGKDSINSFDLKVKGNVIKSEEGIKLDGNSYLYYQPLLNDDVTDLLDSFTITCWAKEDEIGSSHRFMIGSGVAYTSLGFGMGFYETNSAYIVPIGGADGYANNFVTSSNDTFGPYATDYNISTEWNLYTLMLQNGTSYFGVNGHLYQININVDMKKIANSSQTFTIGGVSNNKGSAFYNGFKGEISDVRIYSGILSEGEFNKMYLAGKNKDVEISKENSILEVLNKASNEYDVEVESPKMAYSDILEVLNNQTISVKMDNGETNETKAIYNKIEVNGSEAIASGIVTFANAANSLKIKAHIIKGGSSSISLNTTFTDHMVLQRNKKVKIFGYGGDVGGIVKVSFNGQEKETEIKEDGWALYLDEMKENNVGSDLKVSYGKQEIILKDVVVGEVLLCSGQSNMAITLNYIYNKDKKVKLEYYKYDNYENIRVLDMPYASASEPKIYDKATTSWKICNTLEESMNYSAYALAVASNYQALLGDVVVGIITSSVGGSCIEEWLDKDSLNGFTSYAASMNKVDSQYYNAMIYNLSGYTLSGIVWYQGEANSQPRMVEDYRKAFTNYAKLYRKIFEDESLPIFVEQLVQFDSWCDLYQFRQMQWDLMDEISNVYTICGIDTGSMETSDGIHATDKFVLGGRVAGAISYHYGITKDEYKVNDLPYGLSPSIISASIIKKGNSNLITIKTNADGSLKADGIITGFQVVYNNAWIDVEANIVDGIIQINCPYNVSKIRYNCATGYKDGNGVFVYNNENLPLAPRSSFTLDNLNKDEDDSKDSSSEESSSSEQIEDSSSEEESKYKEKSYNPSSSSESSDSKDEKEEETKKGCSGNASISLTILALFTFLLILKRRIKA